MDERNSCDTLGALVESLPEDAIETAISLLSHLEDDEPFSETERRNLETPGPMLSLDDYERQSNRSVTVAAQLAAGA